MEIVGNINLAESKGELRSYSNPQDKSKQDGIDFKYKDRRLSLWKARYSYSPQSNKNNSRDFCVKMVDLAKDGIVYRMEDIKKMGADGVNSGLAQRGHDNYSIWLYKGGAVCHHFWLRHIYVRKWNAVNVPSWVSFLGDAQIPKMSKWYYQTATYLLLKGTGLPEQEVRNSFVKIIDFQRFVEDSAKGYFQRYVMGLDMPQTMKTVLFNRYGKTGNTAVNFLNTLLRGRTFALNKAFKEVENISDKGLTKYFDDLKKPTSKKSLANPASQDLKDSGKLYDQLNKILKGVVRGNERKIGLPKPRSKTTKLENDEEIEVREARRRAIKYPANDPLVATKPKDMRNKGFVNYNA